jgi:release factor glutamine methyltransferase
LLIAHACERNRSWLYAHLDDPAINVDQIEDLVERRFQGEPMAYILGIREFYGREFYVTPDVLIPRPETELLIDLSLELSMPDDASVLDIGTGSGCIALTLAAERADWTVEATDVCEKALAVAGRNRDHLGLERVQLLQADLFPSGCRHDFNLIVSNPPYIAENDEHLKTGDVRFEPAHALSPGADDQAIIRRLVSRAPTRLASSGWLLIEHGYDQGPAVAKLFRQQGFRDIRTVKDLAGHDRVTMGMCGQQQAA